MTPPTSIRDEVIDYCAMIGADSMLVQGAGGNVSWKDGDTLWIKASGTWLADAKKTNIFVPVDFAKLKAAITDDDFSVIPTLVSSSKLRPSIETLLHGLMPHRVVVHLHAIEALAYLVRYEADLLLENKLIGLSSWSYVAYQKPGEALARAVALAINNKPHIKVLLLENHGIVIGGDDVDEVNITLTQLLRKLSEASSNLLSSNLLSSTVNSLPINVDGVDQYFPIQFSEINNLALKQELFNRIQTEWALYPDHLVFLGPIAFCFDSLSLFINSLNKYSPELVFIRNLGVFVKSSFSFAKLTQLKCYFDVIVREPFDIRLKELNEIQISELLNWDAEYYRQNCSRLE